MNVFPIEFIFETGPLWLCWVSPEEGRNFFLQQNGHLIFSKRSKDELMNAARQYDPSILQDEACSYDLKKIFEFMQQDNLRCKEIILDVWNLFTDLSYTLGNRESLFCEEYTVAYWKLFSNSEAAPIVDVESQELSTEEIKNITYVFRKGCAMLLENTISESPRVP